MHLRFVVPSGSLEGRVVNRLDAAKRGERFARLSAMLVLPLLCIVPVLLWPQANHTGDVQASSGGSGMCAQTDAAAWSPSKLGEPLMRDPVWVYNNVVPSCGKTDRGASQSDDCETKSGELRR